MNFRDRACAYLSEYRKNVLGLEEAGLFSRGGRDHRLGHILPRGSEERNLLEPYGSTFFASKVGRIKLHQYFHHLNSSQALCINLFYPLMAEGEGDLLLQCLASTITSPIDCNFEVESDLEIAARRTSFDFHVRSREGEQILVEVKYTEDGFGSAEPDDEHLVKFQDTYAPLLRNSAYLTDECNDPHFFLSNYQVLRNLVHITSRSEVRFVFPRANTKVAKQAEDARVRFLTDSGRSRFRVIYLEDVVTELAVRLRGRTLENYYERFSQKYLGCEG
jgi:hypothetical protein